MRISIITATYNSAQTLRDTFESVLRQNGVDVEQKDRIGKKPLLHIMDELHSCDIDWPDDFIIAEIMYKNLYGKK